MVYTSEHPIFSVTADVVAFALHHGELSVLLVERARPPYEGRWALPGGFVDEGEDLLAAGRRELAEETGVEVGGLSVWQLGAYGAPDRDPRGRVVSVAHVAVLATASQPLAADDAADARWRAVGDLADRDELAFDHHLILGDALRWLDRRLEHTGLAAAFLPEEFTVAELREVYEVVWGRALDPGNFQRKVTGADGFLVESGRRPARGRGRPATLYRRGTGSCGRRSPASGTSDPAHPMADPGGAPAGGRSGPRPGGRAGPAHLVRLLHLGCPG